MSLRSRPPVRRRLDLPEALAVLDRFGLGDVARQGLRQAAIADLVDAEEASHLPPPVGQPFFIGQLSPVVDAGPWRGPGLSEWLARVSRWPVPWVEGGSRVVW